MDTTACRPAEVAPPSPEFPELRFEAVSADFRGLAVGGPCNNSWQDHSRKSVTVIAGCFGALPFFVLSRNRANRNVDLRACYLVRTLGMAAFAPLFQALGLKVRYPSHCGDSNQFADLRAMSAQPSANRQACARVPEPMLATASSAKTSARSSFSVNDGLPGTVDQCYDILPPEEQAGNEFTCVCVLGTKSKRSVLDL